MMSPHKQLLNLQHVVPASMENLYNDSISRLENLGKYSENIMITSDK